MRMTEGKVCTAHLRSAAQIVRSRLVLGKHYGRLVRDVSSHRGAGAHRTCDGLRRPPMKARRSFSFLSARWVCVGFGGAGPAVPAQTTSAGVNLAVVAKPSCSYVSGDTTPAALNDGYDPRSSRDNRRGSYGNWPRHGTQWVQYDWSQPISTNKIDVYWWDDQQGRAPAQGLPAALLGWQRLCPGGQCLRPGRGGQPVQHDDLRRGPDRQAQAGDRRQRHLLYRHPGMEGL